MSDGDYEDDVTLAGALAQWMSDHKLTQDAMALMIGVTQPRISAWLAGATPRPEHYPTIAEVLGVSETEVAAMAYRGRGVSNEQRFSEFEQRLTALEEGLREIRQVLARRGSKR